MKSAVLYQSFFSETGLENSREIPAKSAVFSANLPLKIPRNLTFFSATYQKPWKKENKPFLTSRGKHEAINTLCHPLASPFIMVARICFNVDIFPLVIVLVLHVTSMFNFCLVLLEKYMIWPQLHA